MRWYASICQKLGENKPPFSNIKLLLSIGTATVQNLFQSCQEVNIHRRERKREREGKKIFFPAVCKVDTNASGRRLTTWHMSNKSKAWEKSQQFTVQESITGIKKYNPTNFSLKICLFPNRWGTYILEPQFLFSSPPDVPFSEFLFFKLGAH